MALEADRDSDEASEEELLPDADIVHLKLRGLRWSAEMVGDMIDLIIPDYPVPDGYDRSRTDLLLHLPTSWPDGTPDMFLVSPSLKIAATDAWPAAAASFPNIRGRQWQQWSRHFQALWRPGVDDLATYLAIVDQALADAVR